MDQVEYVIVNNEPIPVAIIELTRYDHDEHDGLSQSWAKYKSSVLERYFFRDSQGRFIKSIAKGLDVPAYLVLFRKDLKSFHIFDMIDPQANWIYKNEEEYKEWLCDLKIKILEKIKNEDN